MPNDGDMLSRYTRVENSDENQIIIKLRKQILCVIFDYNISVHLGKLFDAATGRTS
jgi:hypothetical protein